MKTSLLTLLLMIGLSHDALAQNPPISVGFRTGVGLTFLTENYTIPDLEKSTGMCYTVGGVVSIPLGGIWSFQPEVHFNQEYGKRIDTSTMVRLSENGTPIGKINYASAIYQPVFTSLSFPLLVKANLGEILAQRMSVFVGPTIGYILSGKSSSENRDPLGHPVARARYDVGTIQHFQTIVTMGVEYRVFNTFMIDVRYNSTFTNYVDTDMYQLRFSNAQLGLTYLF